MSFVDDVCAHSPEAVAIRTPDGQLTYGELTDRIQRLAQVLAGDGLGPEQVCAIAVEHGVEAVIAMAAVARAGGAFLALDADLPSARLDAMCRTGGARMLVTTTALAKRLTLPITGPVIAIDQTVPPAEAVRLPEVTPRTLAYVSHTSGSTGAPNAVLVEHGGLRSYLRAIGADNGLGPRTVTLQVAPIGYDASIRDVFAPLVAGGCVVLVPRAKLLRPDEFADTVRTFGVTTLLSVTPSFLGFLAGHEAATAALRTVELIVSSGESLLPFLVSGGRGLLPGRLVNQYGPTECTMTSTRYPVPGDPVTAADLIGTPIDGVSVWLLGPDHRPVPDGATGEVHIGGVGVARGYGGRPGLTAERFVPDPFGPPGARLYRTGDLARRHADGNLVYLGRADRQLKIRGYRVDPAEIEGALLSHPAVTGAVLTADKDERGRVGLTAHVVGELDGVPDTALRAHLAGSLPPYMMPRRFVRIASLPTTHSGKTDRKVLTLTQENGPR
ncbi:amino acid adenylation domain-containing protein [Amycolatopsis sp. BJA-103]|uniref:amino acid adenylation domain-containing protein n=1 Tax=Amycolatopsis sp. BJA-103 TaxID=1911175 RepID=UPI000C79217C|nr:amino acid adenylation domain-containing protein [Amycolatopsis sp. BJA-103]AUI58208.1 thioester reductase [Amycolatopsis sp. BJA-103]PNE14932.1 thioester reductase [Amycolatopsis sp. BJA-103]